MNVTGTASEGTTQATSLRGYNSATNFAYLTKSTTARSVAQSWSAGSTALAIIRQADSCITGRLKSVYRVMCTDQVVCKCTCTVHTFWHFGTACIALRCSWPC
jgi:hypothetical protein